jgi:hypothetical protein
MNKFKKTLYFFSLVLLSAGFSTTLFSMSTKDARAQIDAIVKDGAWGVAAVSADGKKTWTIDYKTLTYSGNSVEFWMLVTDQPLGKVVIDCSRQKYRLSHFQIVLFESGLKTLVDDGSFPEGSVFSVIHKKLCGRLVPALGVIVKYLSSTDTTTFYWVPSFAYRVARSVTIPVYIESPAGAPPGEISAGSTFAKWEFDCVESRGRIGSVGPWGKVPDIGETEEWQSYGEGTVGSLVRAKLCSDPTIVLRQTDLRPSESANAGRPLEAVEKVKAKCVELGFKAGTERFGECVLTLSK